MSYIIIWNSSNRDSHIHTNSHGFIEHFANQDDAVKEAIEYLDGEYLRDFVIYKEV